MIWYMRTTKKHIIWNYLGTLLNQGMTIFILPVVLRMLSMSELGLWYVFGSIAALVNLIDFGFSPTIMRNISYAFGGAKVLLPEGVTKETLSGMPNLDLLNALITASKKIYLGMSLVAGLSLVSIGTLYIKSVSGDSFSLYQSSWFIYALAVYINLYYSYWNPVLRGVGGIKEINQATLISRVLYLIIATSTLIAGLGLLGLSIAYLVSGIVLRFIAKYYFTKMVGEGIQSTYSSINIKEIFRTIWPNAKKSGIVTIGAWLINRSTTMLCSSFLGLEETAKFGLSLQVLTFVLSFSTLMFNSYIPEIAYLEVIQDRNRYKTILSRGVIVQWIIGIMGISGILVVGNWALGLLKSNSTLLPIGTLLILSIMLFLEQNHSTFATVITLSNSVPFVKASIYSGLAIVFLGYLILKFTSLGLLGLIIVQGIVQLAYNNWYWPRLVLKKEHLTPIRMLQLAVSKNIQ